MVDTLPPMILDHRMLFKDAIRRNVIVFVNPDSSNLTNLTQMTTMRRLSFTIILLLTTLLWPSELQAGRYNNRRSNLYFDSAFRAIQVKHCMGSIEALASDIEVMLRDATEQRNIYGQALAWLDLARYESVEYKMDSAFVHVKRARMLMENYSTPFLDAYLHYVDGIIYYVTNQYATSYGELEQALEGFRKMNDSLFMGKILVNMANIYTNEGIWEKSEKLLNQAFMTCTEPFRPSVAMYKADAKVRQGLVNESFAYIREGNRLMIKMGLPYEKIDALTAFFWRGYFHILYYAYQRSGQQDSAELCMAELTKIVEKFGTGFEKANVRLIEAEQARSNGPQNRAIFICRDVFQNYAGPANNDIAMASLALLHKTYGDLGAYADAYKTMEQYSKYQQSENEENLHTMELLHQYKTYLLETKQHKKIHTIVWTMAGISVAITLLLCLLMWFTVRRMTRRKSRLRVQVPAPVPSRATLDAIAREENREAWNDFEQQFLDAHPNFCNKIQAINSELTDTEMKICMLIKGGSTDSDIMKTLHLSESSVRSYRSRIRKKMGVANPETSIETFLENYE